MSLIRFIDPAFTLSISYEKIPERINYELFKNVSFFLLIFSIEELKFAFTGTKISGKRNHWRVRTTVRTRLTKVVNASDCSDSGLSFLPVSASTLLFSNI